jgi:hypothetical protein
MGMLVLRSVSMLMGPVVMPGGMIVAIGDRHWTILFLPNIPWRGI